MISQQALKKAPVKPSGPGALSEGMEYLVFFYLFLGERQLQIGEIVLVVAKGMPIDCGSSRHRGANVIFEIISNHLFFS